MSNVLPQDARQYALTAYVEFDFEDIPGAVVVNLAEIPQGSVLTSGYVFVETAFAGGSTHDAEFGDETDDDRYSGTIVELDAGGRPTNDFTVDDSKTASADRHITITPVHTGGDPTSGAARLLIDYVTDGRHNENRG